jgi:hypothetical protein
MWLYERQSSRASFVSINFRSSNEMMLDGACRHDSGTIATEAERVEFAQRTAASAARS